MPTHRDYPWERDERAARERAGGGRVGSSSEVRKAQAAARAAGSGRRSVLDAQEPPWLPALRVAMVLAFTGLLAAIARAVLTAAGAQ